MVYNLERNKFKFLLLVSPIWEGGKEMEGDGSSWNSIIYEFGSHGNSSKIEPKENCKWSHESHLLNYGTSTLLHSYKMLKD